MRQKAGRVTAIDGMRAERVCADSVQDVRRQRSGNAQTTEVSAKLKSAVSMLNALCCVVLVCNPCRLLIYLLRHILGPWHTGYKSFLLSAELFVGTVLACAVKYMLVLWV